MNFRTFSAFWRVDFSTTESSSTSKTTFFFLFTLFKIVGDNAKMLRNTLVHNKKFTAISWVKSKILKYSCSWGSNTFSEISTRFFGNKHYTGRCCTHFRKGYAYGHDAVFFISNFGDNECTGEFYTIFGNTARYDRLTMDSWIMYGTVLYGDVF